MANKIIQWNAKSVKANRNELLFLIEDLCPSIIYLQETFLKDNENIDIKNYTSNNFFSNSINRTLGGNSILVKNNIPQRKIDLNITLLIVTIRKKTIFICSVYITPNDPIDGTEFDKLLKHLTKPF